MIKKRLDGFSIILFIASKPMQLQMVGFQKKVFKLYPKILADAFEGFDGLDVMPESAFSPKSFTDGIIRKTEETYCIHHFDSAWRPESVRKGIRRRQALFATFPRPIAKVLALPLSLWTNLTTLGVAGTIKKLLRK